jgi:hypothetical protein
MSDTHFERACRVAAEILANRDPDGTDAVNRPLIVTMMAEAYVKGMRAGLERSRDVAEEMLTALQASIE